MEGKRARNIVWENKEIMAKQGAWPASIQFIYKTNPHKKQKKKIVNSPRQQKAIKKISERNLKPTENVYQGEKGSTIAQHTQRER